VLFGLSRPEPVEGLTTRTELVEVFIHLTFSFRLPLKRSIFKMVGDFHHFKLSANFIFLKKKLRFVFFQDTTISFIDLET
jgi:hypothetical protein